MKEAGITVIRTNDIHGSWDRLDPQRGHFRFDVLERFYRKGGKHQIKVLLGTGAVDSGCNQWGWSVAPLTKFSLLL